MLSSVFKAYDVRAVYPAPLNADVARRIGWGAGDWFMEQSPGVDAAGPVTIAVGHDMRTSSPELVEALEHGLQARGCHVVHVGLVDTPFIAFAVNHLGADGGIQTTASHNPAHYNGFKICTAGARPVGLSTGLDSICQRAEAAPGDIPEPAGSRSAADLWDAYRAHVFQFLSPSIQQGEVRVRLAVDASNGMAGTMMPALFGNVAGLDLTKINFENDTGVFVHEPNPLVESNLQQVRDAVVAEGLQAGICFDGDADRCMVVDEKGDIIGCDLLTAWLAGTFLQDEQAGGAIVYDLRSSHCVPEAVSAAGGTPVRSRVGHVYMKQEMASHDAVFGGELSGHFYFRANWFADSGAMAFAVVASAIASSDRPLSECIQPYRHYAQSGEINFETPDKQAAMEALQSAYPDARIDDLDGVTLESGDWWCNVRPSNTEPLLRLNLEGPDPGTVESRVAEISPLLGTRVEH